MSDWAPLHFLESENSVKILDGDEEWGRRPIIYDVTNFDRA